MTFHCLIVGSRGYTDYASFKAKCDALLADKTDIEIVSGGASGTDALAERYAHERGYSLQIFPAVWSRYGKRAGYVRNREMHSYISTFIDRGVIAFWDGQSKGTAQSFALSMEFDNPLRVIRIDPSHRSSVSKVSYMTHIDTPLKQLHTNGLPKAVLRLTSVSALPQGVKDRK